MLSPRSWQLPLLFSGLAAASLGCGRPSSTPTPAQGTSDAGGSVYLWESTDSDGGIFYEMDALLPDPFWATNVCDGVAQKAGNCCFVPPLDGGTPLPAQISSGDLTVSNYTRSVAIGKLAFVAPDGYPVVDWYTPGWRAADVLDVKSAGADIPAFDVQALAPAHIANLQPPWTTALSITRSKDFVVSWTPDPGAQVMRVILSALVTSTQQPHGTIWCQVADSAGTLSVPASLLQNFSAGDDCDLCVVARGNDGASGSRINLRVQTRVAGGAGFKASFQ